tara:strand:- start:15789 stop:16355 length:567 start_codon:yes stop_codon:yes gene_type:complete
MNRKLKNNKIKNYCYILLIFSLASCGIRVDDETFDNIFPGTWEVSSVKCFRDGVAVENYTTTQAGRIIRFAFENKSFTYTVSDTGSGTCTLNMTGLYSTVFSSSTGGTMTMFSLNNANTCNITLSDSGSGASNQVISFTLLEVLANNLEFNFSSNRLDLEFPTSFDGSPESSLCANVCQCFLVATKTN